MRVLIVGATGFIGARVAAALHALGHDVIGCARSRREAFARHREHGWIGVDFACDLEPRVWRPRLYAIDAVVNCAGVLHESATNTYEAANALGPAVLFEACERLGVRRVLHLTALGAAGRGRSRFLAAKRYADAALESSALDWTVLALAPVFGGDGMMSRALAAFARLPEFALGADRDAPIAPVHIDDVVQAVVALLDPGAPVRTRLALVGPETMSIDECMARLRRMERPGEADAADGEALALAACGMASDPGPFTALLGHPPRAALASTQAAWPAAMTRS